MSTIPLSMREGHGQTLSGGDAPVPARDDDDQLNALIENVTETIASRDSLGGTRDEILLDEPADDGDTWRDLKVKLDHGEASEDLNPDMELDRALKVAVERRASQETESADFHQSREWRDALRERYDGRVAIGDLLEAFAGWHERLKENPRAAADAIAAAYLEQAPYALPDKGRPNKYDPQANAANTGPEQKLNGILTAAIDRHHGKGSGEQQAFTASARHRAALKEMFPGMTYAEACRRVVTLDGDLHRDPIASAARLAASYGMPATPSQQLVVEQRDPLASVAKDVVATTAEYLPDMADIEDDVISVLQRPEFVHGPDMQQNLLRAHRVAQLARHRQGRSDPQHRAQRQVAPDDLDGLIGQAMQGGSRA